MRIVHFDIDSLRPDHLGCHGYPRPTSPNIDRVAAAGVRFDRCYASDSPCMPSRAAFVTGRFGRNNGVVTHGERWNTPNIPQHAYGGPLDDYPLLPIHLRKHGLDAVGFSTFPVRHMASWFSLGWSEFHTPSLDCGGEYAGEVVGRVLDWLGRNEGRDDYFLYVNLWDPHRIYKDDLHEWAERFEGVPPADDWPDEAAIARHQDHVGPFTANRQGGAEHTRLMPDAVRSRDDVRRMIDGYDAMIAYTDHHVGRVLDAVGDDAAVVVTADHGDAFGEHGVYSDHCLAHEPVQRVPLIVRWPGVAPAVRDDLVYQLDWTATLCDLIGGGVPGGLDGASLAGVLRGEQGPGRSELFLGHGLYALQRAVRTDRHLLLRTYHPHEFEHLKDVELYDVSVDPHLTQDLAGREPAVAADLLRRLEGWLAEQAGKPFAIEDPLLRVADYRRRRESSRPAAANARPAAGSGTVAE